MKIDGFHFYEPKKSKTLSRFGNCMIKHYKMVMVKTCNWDLIGNYIPINPDGSVYVNKACGMVPMFDVTQRTVIYLIATYRPDALMSEQIGQPQ